MDKIGSRQGNVMVLVRSGRCAFWEAYDFNLNDGNFGSDGVLHYAYRLNGGSFSGIDYRG